MKIIISPAKKMQVDTDSFSNNALPQYLDEANQILDVLTQKSYTELKNLWNCSDKIAQENYLILQKTDLYQNLTPAIIAYSGIQYQYMAPDLFTSKALNYVQSNLRILSGFYGILRPFDGVVPYRLEMQAPLKMGNNNNLYEFWGDKLYTALDNSDQSIINLASQEYSKIIRRYLNNQNQLVDIVFGQIIDGKIKTRATLAKMARGEMVRFMAENNVHELTGLTKFNRLNYHYVSELSTDSKLTFLKS
ncbi:peroxide stress protein YaaA [Pediococcus claussenii]|uniref:UPF0246 protein PECL_1818 n=1 Tax=Pediococcus claussenii (strain ATCC BAA-344 / DSM 14800 / JCM 18046 / KCTC 3811 / LMG 21948 / P06) TaxID=701521 RepID=G8PBX1_PEDCP|nr:peroxide stress protein YaaA [Pediococcus claussenii]AEV96029.1 hypothetical protein PECL_1818 [Pediococcus claussenii ATCC BAA-344]ANZ69514.1 hypothetical protein AYR57_03950 [Pediococcus claussenii]ANZ71333.1 hypothetical protein AYR58_03965 [Pediococcus claussenii]KRN19445.1 hypothetical protein IV79_GL001498 [Pediococcus claussenii]